MLIQNTTTIKKYDENNMLLNTEETVSTVNYLRSNEEGNFIKIYTENFEVLNTLPSCCLHLLFELCKHISYANISDKYGGQLIRINKSMREDIQETLGIKKRAFFSNLKILKDKKIVKDFGNGDYQVNPNIIGKGLFEYNPKLKYGGIKDIRESFNSNRKTTTQVEYDIPLIKESLEIELDKMKEEYGRVRDREVRKIIAEDITAYEIEINRLNDTEYTKNINYEAIEKLQNNIKESHAEIVEVIEEEEFGEQQ